MSETCNYPHESSDVTGISCELPEGHKGEHESVQVISWPDWGWSDA
jgi:hypothetical protein